MSRKHYVFCMLTKLHAALSAWNMTPQRFWNLCYPSSGRNWSGPHGPNGQKLTQSWNWISFLTSAGFPWTLPVGFQGHKSLGNSHPAEHLLDDQTTVLGQSPLTAAVTTFRGGSRFPGQAKTHLMLSLTALCVLHLHCGVGQGYTHIVLWWSCNTKYCKCILSRCLCWSYLVP